MRIISMTFSFMVHWLWKLGFRHGGFWTSYKTNGRKKKKSLNKKTHTRRNKRKRCQRRSGRKLDSIYKSSSRARQRLSFHFLPETECVFLQVSHVAARPYLSLGIPPLAYVLVQPRAVCGRTGCKNKRDRNGIERQSFWHCLAGNLLVKLARPYVQLSVNPMRDQAACLKSE